MNSDTIQQNPMLFKAAVCKLANRQGFLAHVFSVTFAGDVSPQRISRELGCTEDIALRLSMMRAPAATQDKFLRDIDMIVGATGVERTKLLEIVRQYQVLEAFGESDDAMLLAARDRLDHADE